MLYTKFCLDLFFYITSTFVFLQPEAGSNKNILELRKKVLLKLKAAIFYQYFIFSPNVILQKLQKIFFISLQTLFSFSRYSNFCNFFPSLPCFPDLKRQIKVEEYMKSSIALHKFADVVFGITQKTALYYIIKLGQIIHN